MPSLRCSFLVRMPVVAAWRLLGIAHGHLSAANINTLFGFKDSAETVRLVSLHSRSESETHLGSYLRIPQIEALVQDS